MERHTSGVRPRYSQCMDEQDLVRQNRRRLKSLISANNYKAHHVVGASYMLPFGGKYRDWQVRTHIHNGWICFSAHIMEMPEPGSVRNALLEKVVELNATVSLAKFSCSGNTLRLELEYRDEHVDAEVFGHLTAYYHGLLEQHYPELFRIASGAAALTALQSAFQRPSLPSTR